MTTSVSKEYKRQVCDRFRRMTIKRITLGTFIDEILKRTDLVTLDKYPTFVKRIPFEAGCSYLHSIRWVII